MSTTTTTLAAWRASRTKQFPIGDGLTLTARRVELVDLAAQGQIPAPLLGQVEALLSQAEAAGGRIDLADVPRYAQVIDLVAKAAVVDPPVADEPDETHIGVREIPFMTRIEIFHWAQGEASAVATFPGDAGRGQRTPRGRDRVRAAAQPAAAGELDGLPDRPGDAADGDAPGELPYTAADGGEIGRGIGG